MALTTFRHVATQGSGGDALAICTVATFQSATGATILYGVARGDADDGQVFINTYGVAANGSVTLLDHTEAGAGAVAGINPSMTILPAEQAGTGQDTLMVTGVEGAPIWAHAIGADG